MACKPQRFFSAKHPETGINGIEVQLDASGAVLPTDIIYWSDDTITDRLGNTQPALADLANFAAADAAWQAACGEDVVQVFPAEAPDGTDVLVTVTNGVATGAVGLDGAAYTGALGDLDWVEDSDIEADRKLVCYRGSTIIQLHSDQLNVQGAEDDTGVTTTVTYLNADGSALADPPPTQADFDSGVASYGACKVAAQPVMYPLCGGC